MAAGMCTMAVIFLRELFPRVGGEDLEELENPSICIIIVGFNLTLAQDTLYTSSGAFWPERPARGCSGICRPRLLIAPTPNDKWDLSGRSLHTWSSRLRYIYIYIFSPFPSGGGSR